MRLRQLGVRAGAGIATAALVLVGCTGGGKPSPANAAAAINAGATRHRIVKSIVLDNAQFRADPTTKHPLLPLSYVLLDAASSDSAPDRSPKPTAEFGLVSLSAALFPGVHRVPAWLVFTRGDRIGLHCKFVEPNRRTSTPIEPHIAANSYRVFIVFDDPSRGALGYFGVWGPCGGHGHPSVSVAHQLMSVPWRLLSTTTNHATIEFILRPCQTFDGGAQGVAPNGSFIVLVRTRRPFGTPTGCAPTRPMTEVITGQGNHRLEHAPVGPITTGNLFG